MVSESRARKKEFPLVVGWVNATRGYAFRCVGISFGFFSPVHRYAAALAFGEVWTGRPHIKSGRVVLDNANKRV